MEKHANVVFDYLSARQHMRNARLPATSAKQCVAQRLPEAMRETTLPLGQVDKVFAAQWLDERNIITGTKCNKLLVQNIDSKKLWQIPLLRDSGVTPEPDKNCGIHSISINRAGTRLATGGENPSVVGFYDLPSVTPSAVGEFHKDWLFTSAWISDDILATGSRDKNLAFWSLAENQEGFDSDTGKVPIIKPVFTVEGNRTLDKVRAMVYNPFYEHLTTIASNGFVHIWDVNNGMQMVCNALPFLKENVCIAHEPSNLLYAVGSLSHVSLLETRSARAVGSLCSSDQGAGVRSVSFNDCIITIGTGYGSLLFYDIRVNKLLEQTDTGAPLRQCTGAGWLRYDSVYREFFWDTECYPNAVYAHSYHPTTMRLLTVGGPLALGLYGNYCAYWD